MKKQFFTFLLLGLIGSIGNVWGTDWLLDTDSKTGTTDNVISYTISSLNFSITEEGSTNVAGTGNNKTEKMRASKTYTISIPASINVTSITFKGYTNDGSASNYVSSINGATPKRSGVEVSAGTDVFTGSGNKNDESKYSSFTYDATKLGSSTITFAITSSNNKQTCLKFTITGTTTPSLVGAWSPTSGGTIWNGDEVPEPTFGVTASDASSITRGTHYTLIYSVKEGSTAGMITIPDGGQSFTLNNSVNGTATLVATLTSTNESNYTTPATNTFEYVYTVNAKVPTYTLNKADNDISLRSTPVHRAASTNETATVTMEAGFLEGTSGTVAFVESIDGLSLSPSSFTISDGSVAETEFTVTYNSASGASGTATLRFTDGNSNTKDLVIEYTSVVAHTWATISSATTWDWTKLTGENSELKASTSPTNAEEFLLGDMDGEILTQDIGYDTETFNADALKVICQYAVRDNKYLQGNSVKFQTSVPGTVTVVFSNTGGSRPYRYLTINGVMTEFKSAASSEKDVTASNIYVPAGEVIITGYIPDAADPTARKDDVVGATMLRFYSITFTPLAGDIPSTVGSTITACGYNTFSSIYPLDLSTLTSGMKAYVVSSITDNKAVLSASTAKVPARTGLIIKGTAGSSFTIATTSDATTTPATNLLVGVPNGTTVEKASGSYNNYVFGWEDTANPGFYLINGTSASLSAGKAYLHTSSTLTSGGATAPSIIRIEEEENNATDVQSSKANEKAVKFIENGQLLILRDGITYDALGRVIR